MASSISGHLLLSGQLVKYQIIIPRSVRMGLSIVPGSEVDIRKERNQYVLVVDSIADLRKNWQGKFKGKQSSDEHINDIRGKVN